MISSPTRVLLLRQIKKMGIHQLSVTHDERQDRLLLRVGTHEAQEFRFWLTRRMVQRLLPVLEQALQQSGMDAPGVVAQDAHSRQMVSEFQRERFMQQADFQTPYVPREENLPLGQQPLLLTDVQITPQPDGELLLALHDSSVPEGLSCQLRMHVSLLHGLVHLIGQAAAQSDWALSPAPERSAPPAADPASAAPYRH